jgi:hypothetical protein
MREELMVFSQMYCNYSEQAEKAYTIISSY